MALDSHNQAFAEWYAQYVVRGKNLIKGSLAGALVVLDRLKTDFNLDIENHTTVGGSQIRGAGRSAVRRILLEFGETRPFLSEGGRTNRGLRGAISALLKTIGQMDIGNTSAKSRLTILNDFQKFLVGRLQEFHAQQCLAVPYSAARSTLEFVSQLLASAKERNKYAAVAQYLIGAKLQLRFPKLKVPNELHSTADQSRGQPGDFRLGDTVFHVTVVPGTLLFEKCKRNVAAGLHIYILVPDKKVIATRDEVTSVGGAVTVLAIEDFISQNIDELGDFSIKAQALTLRKLLLTYNERVNAIEHDKSLLIEVPPNLK